MNKKEIIQLLRERIDTCYLEFMFYKDKKDYRADWLEGFRSRLDELLLLWHEINHITFVDAYKEFGIKYEEITK